MEFQKKPIGVFIAIFLLGFSSIVCNGSPTPTPGTPTAQPVPTQFNRATVFGSSGTPGSGLPVMCGEGVFGNVEIPAGSFVVPQSIDLEIECFGEDSKEAEALAHDVEDQFDPEDDLLGAITLRPSPFVFQEDVTIIIPLLKRRKDLEGHQVRLFIYAPQQPKPKFKDIGDATVLAGGWMAEGKTDHFTTFVLIGPEKPVVADTPTVAAPPTTPPPTTPPPTEGPTAELTEGPTEEPTETPTPTPTPPEPILYLPFDGDIGDRSQNRLFTSATGTIEFVPGVYGQAAQFDGSGEAVEVAAGTHIPIQYEMTLEFWVNAADWKNPYTGSAHVESIASRSIFYTVYVDFDTWRLGARMKIENTGDFGIPLEGGQLQPGKWHHVALVYRAKEEAVLLFLDGKVVAEQIVSGRVETPNEQIAFTVGTWYQQNQAFAGAVDELRLYDVGLSNEVIQWLAQMPAR